MEYYSAVRRNEIELFVVRGMDLGSVMQREVSLKLKKIPYANIYTESKKNGSDEPRGRTGIKMQT